eukprot:8772029-Prorocentrum_lima.AAC.1
MVSSGGGRASGPNSASRGGRPRDCASGRLWSRESWRRRPIGAGEQRDRRRQRLRDFVAKVLARSKHMEMRR